MEQSTEIRDIITSWFDAVGQGDPAWLDRYLSPKVLVVGTDPNEWLDFEQASTLLKSEVQEFGTLQLKISMNRAEGFREGSVGWGIAHPTITFPNGKSFSPRWAAVFHQEDGQWKAVQIHASLGVTNEALMKMLAMDASG
jgi:ketosteroid isomerase-like protein